MHPGESEEPIVVVKRAAVDPHGDMRRGENGAKARSKPALGKKAIAEAKGGTYRKADNHAHAGRVGIEKTRKGSPRPKKERATYKPSGSFGRNADNPTSPTEE